MIRVEPELVDSTEYLAFIEAASILDVRPSIVFVTLKNVRERSKKDSNGSHVVDCLEGSLRNLDGNLSLLEVLLGDGKHEGTCHEHHDQNDEDHVQNELQGIWSNVAGHLLCVGTEY